MTTEVRSAAPEGYEGPVLEQFVYRSVLTKNIVQVPQGPATSAVASFLAGHMPGRWVGVVVGSHYMFVLDQENPAQPWFFEVWPGQQIHWTSRPGETVNYRLIGTTSVEPGQPLVAENDGLEQVAVLQWPLET